MISTIVYKSLTVKRELFSFNPHFHSYQLNKVQPEQSKERRDLIALRFLHPVADEMTANSVFR